MRPTETIAGYEIHPAAALFPLMSDSELRDLAADIAEHGLLSAIVLHEGKVLDGRNRLLACERAGRRPEFRDWNGEGSPIAWVLSLNLRRRHLSESQAAMIAVEALPLFEEEAKARKTGRPPKESATGRTHNEVRQEKRPAAAEAARSVGVGTRTVERAKAVKKQSADLAEKVRAGELTLNQAAKQIRRAEQIAQVKAYVPPAGEYPVIAVDPPWPYEDKLEGVERELPYPTMTVEEICELKIPAAADCALFLWTTNSHLIDGTATGVLSSWGFEPKALITWVKDRIGLGRYVRNNTEQCIIAVRGKPVFNLDGQKAEEVCSLLAAPVGDHSEKPDLFFRLVERICPATSRLEMFARAPREGWVTSGAELPASPFAVPDALLHQDPPPTGVGAAMANQSTARKRLLIEDR